MDDSLQTDHDRIGGLAGRIAPVGRRLLGRQARLRRATGQRLGEAVAARHEPPKAAEAARRLAPVRLVTRSAAAPAAASSAAPGPAESGWEPSTTESTVLPGMSDWAAEWMFGDQGTALATGDPWMGGIGLEPRTPEQKRLSRVKRGGLEVSRGAKILEGDEQPPAPPEPGEAPSPPAPRRLARAPRTTE
ncbi:MAG: hypothetical protein ACRDPC_08495, partial [Solirubrobacteraceae bacterium]